MGLKNKTILVTRQVEQSSEFIAEVERRGGRVVAFPTIMITDPDSWADCDRALATIGTYDGLIFTSTNGVEKFFERSKARGMNTELFGHLTVYAVGEKTKNEVERRGVQVSFVPDRYSAASLAKYFTTARVQKSRFLFPLGNLSKTEVVDKLNQLGAVVDPVVVYKTAEADGSGSEEIIRQLSGGQIDVVTFASPSAAQNFVKVFPQDEITHIHERTKIAVIGPSTAEAVRSLGLHVDIIATTSTVRGLVEAIADHFD